MKYRFTALVGLFLMALSIMAEGQAKYVFYFIGDGMGVNQVNVSETYLGALEGRIGTVDMCFPSFPFAGVATTHSANSGVTDSAAGGTALATGHKTVNGTLGMKADKKEAVQSVAVWAQDAGAAVGITTSVSVDHATPASFYAHVPNRSEYYKVGSSAVPTCSNPRTPQREDPTCTPSARVQATPSPADTRSIRRNARRPTR